MPKLMTDLCQKLVTKEIIEVIKNHIFPNGKIITIHCKTMVFEGLTVCVREQGFHYKCTKNKSKIHPEIDAKNIGIRVQKRNTQNNGKTSKMESKRQPKSSNMQQKRVHKSMSRNAEWKSTRNAVEEPTQEAIPTSALGSRGLIYPHVVVTTERV